MDTDTKLRQMHKDEFYRAWYAIEAARNHFAEMTNQGVLTITPVEEDLIASCMHRMEFAFQTLLEVVVNCMDAYTADSTLQAVITHPDGFFSVLERISDGELSEV